MRPLVLLFATVAACLDLTEEPYFPLPFTQRAVEVGWKTCNSATSKAGVAIEFEPCSMRVMMMPSSVSPPKDEFYSKEDIYPHTVLVYLGASLMAQSRGPWPATIKSVPQFQAGEQTLTVLIFGNKTIPAIIDPDMMKEEPVLLRRYCLTAKDPFVGCGLREIPTVTFEIVPILIEYELQLSNTVSVTFFADVSDELPTEDGALELEVFDNGVSVTKSSNFEWTDTWPPVGGPDTELWAPHTLGCKFQLILPQPPDGRYHREVVAVWSSPTEVLGVRNIILTTRDSPTGGWMLPTQKQVRAKSMMRIPRYLVTAKSLEEMLAGHAARVAKMPLQAHYMYEPRPEAGWGNRFFALLSSYLTGLVNGRPLLVFFCDPFHPQRYFSWKQNRGGRWAAECGDRPLSYLNDEMAPIFWDVAELTAARLRFILRVLPEGMQNDGAFAGYVFDRILEPTPFLLGKVAEARQGREIKVGVQARVGGSERFGGHGLYYLLRPDSLLIMTQCVLELSGEGDTIFLSGDGDTARNTILNILKDGGYNRTIFQHCTNTVSTCGELSRLSLLRGRIDNNLADDGSRRTIEKIDTVLVDWMLLAEAEELVITSLSTFGSSAATLANARGRKPAVLILHVYPEEQEIHPCEMRKLHEDALIHNFMAPFSVNYLFKKGV